MDTEDRDHFKTLAMAIPTRASPPPAIVSSKSLEPSMTQHQVTYAAERAKLLFGSYRKGDANDPDTYVAAITAVLSEYPPDVVKRVTDPRLGIARKSKFMPNLCELSEACDAARQALKDEAMMAERGYRWTGEKWEKTGEIQ